jgi:hypothetical protein
MDRLRVDYSRIVRLDVVRLKKPLKSQGPPRQAAGAFERPAITMAASAAAKVMPTAGPLKEICDIAQAGKRIAGSFIGGSGPMFAPPPSGNIFTIGYGFNASAYALVGFTYGAGLYGSNSPELGLYTSPGGGAWTNIGISGGFTYTYVFGPPSAFGGMGWSVGVGVDVTGVGVGISAALLFGASGPPYQFLGFCIGLAVGVSVLPAEFSFTVSNTALIPLR